MVNTAVRPEDIVVQARSWIGTRFQHQGRLKKTAQHAGGCDCLGLLIGVARELGLRSAANGLPLVLYDRTDYGRFPDGNAFKKILGMHLREVDKAERAAGDIALFAFDQNPQHVAIIGVLGDGTQSLIHAYAQLRKVEEQRFSDMWEKRLVAVFRTA